MNEGMAVDTELKSTDDARKLIEMILANGVKSGKILPGEYMIVDEDGVMIGDANDFDADVLLYAINIDDVVDFSDCTVDLSGIKDSELFHNIL